MTEQVGWKEMLSLCNGFKRVHYLQIMARMWGVEVKTFVEVGVYEGRMSKDLRKYYPDAHLYLIDPWKIYPDYLSEEAGPIAYAQSDFDAAYASVCAYFSQDPLTTILRCTSLEGVSLVPDQIDWVFIDGNHAYDYVKKDIEAWFPKVRPGGIISGHDYTTQWFPEVVQAVDEFFPEGVTVGSDDVWLFQKR